MWREERCSREIIEARLIISPINRPARVVRMKTLNELDEFVHEEFQVACREHGLCALALIHKPD